jgi:hypothetical protein
VSLAHRDERVEPASRIVTEILGGLPAFPEELVDQSGDCRPEI